MSMFFLNFKPYSSVTTNYDNQQLSIHKNHLFISQRWPFSVCEWQWAVEVLEWELRYLVQIDTAIVNMIFI